MREIGCSSIVRPLYGFFGQMPKPQLLYRLGDFVENFSVRRRPEKTMTDKMLTPCLPLLSAVALTVVLLAAGGCALSPQSLTLRPFIDVPAEPIGRGRPLVLQVSDERSQAEIGRRGGVYDTASINLGTDVSQAVFAALAERLEASGFEVRSGSDATAPLGSEPADDLELRVVVRRVAYTARPDPLIGGLLFNEISTQAALKASLTAAGLSRSGLYQASSVQRQLGYPTAAENEEIVNEVIAQALKQLLLDPELTLLLAR